MKRLRLISFAAVLAVAAVSCSSANAGGPPDIKYGRDICVQCGMIINEEKFATAYEVADADDLIFDDVGGMVLYLQDTGDDIDADLAWVHDYETEEWVVASAAFFVPTLSVTSPMGHSILAFSDEGRADTFANDVGADVITWATVVSLPATEGLIGHHHMDMDDGMDDDTGEHDHDSDG